MQCWLKKGQTKPHCYKITVGSHINIFWIHFWFNRVFLTQLWVENIPGFFRIQQMDQTEYISEFIFEMQY